MKKPFILITNDDGLHAPGLRHLWQALSSDKSFDLAIVAPLGEASGSSLSITWNRPLHAQPVPWGKKTPAWTVSGTPADCMKMALSFLLKKTPDLIVSGINRGSNLGRTVFYSGTVGAIIEGALKGIPGIAFSFADLEPPSLASTQKYILSLLHHFLKNPMKKGSCLNVNFPKNADEKIAGIRFATQGQSYLCESPIQRIHPAGFPYFWLGEKWLECEEDPESDVVLLAQGYITAVPLHVGDLTDRSFFKAHKQEMIHV